MKNVEDVYPLTPMQSLMLLSATSRGASRDSLLTHFCYELHGTLDPIRFEQSWQVLVDRHPALRTMFLWEGLQVPVQIVRNTVAVPFLSEDWTALQPREQADELDRYCRQDAERGVDPSQAPLMRIALLRLSENRHYFVWSTHHLILDRWSIEPLFAELGLLLDAATLESGEAQLAPAVPFSRYMRWLQRQSTEAARAFWLDEFRGFRNGVQLARHGSSTTHQHGDHAERQLSGEVCHALRALTIASGVTVSIALQAAWALLLNRLTKRQDLCYGISVSGRPPGISGVEQIVGSLVSNLPVRVKLPADGTVGELLTTLQKGQQQRTRYEHSSVAEILKYIDTGGSPFDSILVWLSGTSEPKLESLEVIGLPGQLKTAYPVTVGIAEKPDRLTVSASISGSLYTISNAAELIDTFCECITMLAGGNPDTRLADLPGYHGTPPAAVLHDDSWDFGELPTAEGDIAHEGRERLDEEFLREALQAEWQAVLEDCPEPGPEDDFFDLGGDSLAALTLHANIVAAVRLDVPMIGLFRSPTITGMAEYIAAREWPLTAETVTPLRRSGRSTPLFCVASPEVNTVGYMVLTRHLNDEQPTYVLQLPPIANDVQRLSPSLLPELAERYVEAMLHIQPHGPYRLLGMCTGCHLALEMVRVLERDHKQVAFLGMINTWAQFTVSRLYHVERARLRLSWYRKRSRELLASDPRKSRLERVGELVSSKLHGTEVCIDVKPHAESPDEAESKSRPQAANRDDVIDWIHDIGWAHLRPSGLIDPVSTPVTVFRAQSRQYWRVTDDALGWGRFSHAGARVVLLGNHDHETILREPHVGTLAERLSAELSREGTAEGDSAVAMKMNGNAQS
jgi:thioesterase domain-containing protein